MTGKIKYYNHDRGYGFIQDDSKDQDYFFHFSEIQGFKEELPIIIGQAVNYETVAAPKGTKAVNVVLL